MVLQATEFPSRDHGVEPLHGQLVVPAFRSLSIRHDARSLKVMLGLTGWDFTRCPPKAAAYRLLEVHPFFHGL